MYVDRDSTTIAEIERACVPYDVYAQCGTCGWFGSVGEFAGHVRAKHPRPDVSESTGGEPCSSAGSTAAR